MDRTTESAGNASVNLNDGAQAATYYQLLALYEADDHPAKPAKAIVKSTVEAGMPLATAKAILALAKHEASLNRKVAASNQGGGKNAKKKAARAPPTAYTGTVPPINHRMVAEAFHDRALAENDRWVDDRKKWREFVDGRWLDTSGVSAQDRIGALAADVLCREQKMMGVVVGYPLDPEKGGSTPTAKACLEALKAKVLTRNEEWDAPGDWIAGPDGASLNLRDRTTRPTRPDELALRRLGVMPDEKHRPTIQDFLDETIPEPEEREYWLDLLALALEGRGHEAEVCLWETGPPASGKSMLLDVTHHAFGGFAVFGPPSLICFTEEKLSSFEYKTIIGQGAGARLFLMDDPPKDAKLNVGAYKALTGAPTIQARDGLAMWQARRTWLPIITANKLPVNTESAGARRTAPVQFPNAHTDNPRSRRPKKDPTLPARLRKAAGGLLAILLDRVGQPVPQRTEHMIEAAEPVREPTSFEQFFRECLRYEPGSWLPKREVYELYEHWRSFPDRVQTAPGESAMEKRPRLTTQAIGREMNALGMGHVLKGPRDSRIKAFRDCALKDGPTY